MEPGGNVSVRIEYKEAVETENTQKVDTVHFDKENGEKAEVIDCGTKGSVTSVEAVEFESDQFSVYGIVGMKKALPESIPYMFTGSGGGMSNNTAESGLEIDKTATPLNKDYQSTVTLTFPGMQESYSYDVVFVLDKSASAGNETTEIMKEYISAISGNGAMIKTADDTRIVSAIRKLAQGASCISPDVKRQISANPPVPVLSTRQKEVLKSITQGLTNKEISSQLGIRQDSVEDIINTVFMKLGAANRAEAVAIALRKQLLKI